jgi:hypothetical protein
MRILIETVPHHKNRNDQVGDYRYLEDGTLYITVSDLKDKSMESLVAIHELWEVLTTEAKGITEEEITDYDAYYEKKRAMGFVEPNTENGFARDCIYKEQHTKATAIEMILAAELGVDWVEYDKKVNSL